ncbi:hypothetical protein MTR05_12700 [Staphylococcus agnetis]|uniref:transcriptional regulator, SarA/Rot family n=1 Tax=Staphylococcus agnetis TaxID=985762 RepID=UPI00208EE431|nr:hypothetical protein [Staphylococcus agnetis]MCO4327873.1 hypothetical protein [Staphylococcus agnetis]
MRNMNEILSSYERLGAIRTLDKALKATIEYSILDVLIVKCAYDKNEFIRKSDIEKQLGASPAQTQKSTKQLRKDGYIIKDRDIDDESIIIIGMNDEMRKKAEQLFSEVENVQQGILNGNIPTKKTKKDTNVNNEEEENGKPLENKQEKPQTNNNHHNNHKNRNKKLK